MFKKMGILATCIVHALAAFPQGKVVLRNGQIIDYKKISFRYDQVNIKKSDGSKAEIKIADFAGYFDEPNLKEYEKWDVKDRNSDLPYTFFESVVIGTISLYKERTTVSNTGGPVSTFGGPMVIKEGGDHYLKKGEQAFRITPLPRQTAERELALITLKRFFGDQPELLKTIDTTRSRLKPSYLRDLVTQYNLDVGINHTPIPIDNYGGVTFYSREIRRPDEKFTIQVNDSLQYQLPISYGLTVSLPVAIGSKVCFLFRGANHCRIISPARFFQKYFEITFRNGKGEIELDERDRYNLTLFIERQKKMN